MCSFSKHFPNRKLNGQHWYNVKIDLKEIGADVMSWFCFTDSLQFPIRCTTLKWLAVHTQPSHRQSYRFPGCCMLLPLGALSSIRAAARRRNKNKRRESRFTISSNSLITIISDTSQHLRSYACSDSVSKSKAAINLKRSIL
jgi:hypothetical protein